MNGDELRGLALPEDIFGYLAADVDELLLRIADEIDAGRPVGDLVATATFRRAEPLTMSDLRLVRQKQRPPAYDPAAVHWLLGQLRRRDDDEDRTRLEADPWRDLAPWDFAVRHVDAEPPGSAGVSSAARARPALKPGDRGVPAVTGPAGENADPWLACGQLPGTRLRWVRTGILRSELRTAEHQTAASIRGHMPWNSRSQRTGVIRVPLPAGQPGHRAAGQLGGMARDGCDLRPSGRR